jgi:zinc transporter ZupT
VFAAAIACSLLGLLVGPAVMTWAYGRAVAMAAIDGAILGVVPALLLLRLLPHLVEEVGPSALVAVAGGYVAFLLIEARAHGRAEVLGLALVVPALGLHSFLDGTALALAFSRALTTAGGATLAGAITLHKIPEGMFLASTLTPKVGPRGAWWRIGAFGLTTLAGALTGRMVIAHAPDRAIHIVVAVGLGIMLRMVIHRHETREVTRTERVASGLTFLGCIVAVLAVPSPQDILSTAQPGELSATKALVPLFLVSAPWLLLVLVFSHAVDRTVGRSRKSAVEPSSWVASTVLLTVLLGPPVAIACGLVDPFLRVVARRVVRDLVSARDGLSQWLRSVAPPPESILPSYAVGVVLAVAAEPTIPTGAFEALGWVSIPVAALTGFFIPVGVPGACLLAAMIVHKGAPLAAGLVLLFAIAARPARVGATSIKGRLLHWATRGTLLTLAIIMAVGLGSPLSATVRSLHDIGTHAHPPHEWAAATIVVLWTCYEIVRAGPRAWFWAVVPGRTADGFLGSIHHARAANPT